ATLHGSPGRRPRAVSAAAKADKSAALAACIAARVAPTQAKTALIMSKAAITSAVAMTVPLPCSDFRLRSFFIQLPRWLVRGLGYFQLSAGVPTCSRAPVRSPMQLIARSGLRFRPASLHWPEPSHYLHRGPIPWPWPRRLAELGSAGFQGHRSPEPKTT